MELGGRTAVVTGGSRGIGFAISAALAEAGINVVLGARTPGDVERAAAGLDGRHEGVRVIGVPCDVQQQGDCEALIERAAAEFGRLDILINNAGIAGSIALQQPGGADIDVVREVFETNLVGVIAVTEAMLPLLRRSPAGRIVNMSSSAGSVSRWTDPEHFLSQRQGAVAYPVSKAALNMLTVQYSKELRQAGILVNAADPDACDTDLTKPLGVTLTRTAADGAKIAVKLATLGPDGPTGGVFDDEGPVPW
jgi:NAD(P)-dependent dehydrogenase (short-subunit alcohol dehydrogenase family)